MNVKKDENIKVNGIRVCKFIFHISMLAKFESLAEATVKKGKKRKINFHNNCSICYRNSPVKKFSRFDFPLNFPHSFFTLHYFSFWQIDHEKNLRYCFASDNKMCLLLV